MKKKETQTQFNKIKAWIIGKFLLKSAHKTKFEKRIIFWGDFLHFLQISPQNLLLIFFNAAYYNLHHAQHTIILFAQQCSWKALEFFLCLYFCVIAVTSFATTRIVQLIWLHDCGESAERTYMSYFPQPPTTSNVSAEKAKEHLTVSAFGPGGGG